MKLNPELPAFMSCDLTTAGKDEAKKITIADDHIKRVIALSGSSRKITDYEIQIVNFTAYFTLK